MNEYENSVIPTSGVGMLKKMKRVATIEGVVLVTDGGSKSVLVSKADGISELKFSIEYASGDIKKCQGYFNVESDESEENRTTIVIHPTVAPTRFNA
jgi:hypothetical protein